VTRPRIVRAGAGEARIAAGLVATAFADLPQIAWLVPDPAERARIMTDNFQIFVDHALDHGEIHLLGDHSGVAVWFDRSSAPTPPPKDYDDRLAAACAPYTERFRELDELFDAHHPEQPHHHLALLAVHPGRQGAGLGTALLEHHHPRLDEAGLPAYLEASTPRSRDLYLRHGYQPRGEPFHLGDCATPFWPMWRPPARRTLTGPAMPPQ
jgi:GNAT superfamily N-acetyltransferase